MVYVSFIDLDFSQKVLNKQNNNFLILQKQTQNYNSTKLQSSFINQNILINQINNPTTQNKQIKIKQTFLYNLKQSNIHINQTHNQNKIIHFKIKMKQLFEARNMLKESSFDRFAQYLQKNKHHLTSIDLINLLQQSYHLYKKQFIHYVRLFHRYFHDIVFSQVDNGKRKLTVLEEILTYRKSEELKQLFKIDHRIIKDFNLYAVNCAIDNIYNQKDPRNGYQLVQTILQKKPDIVQDPIYDNRNNPLIESIKTQLYDISCLLLSYQCYLLPTKNYYSNQFHYLFSKRFSKKNQSKMLQLTKLLINRKVDIYQKNQNGKVAIDLCNNDIRDEIMKMYKNSRPNKNYLNHSNSGSIKNNQKYKNNKNDHKYNHNDSRNQNRNNQAELRNSQGQLRNSQGEMRNSQGQKGNKDNSSGHSISIGSSKNIYKGKVKSQFGGKQIIKQNNQLLRINIQNNNLSYKEQSSNIPDSNIVKILSYEELENQASQIFQKHTLKKQQQYMSQKAQYEKQNKQIRQKQPRIIQSQQLKFYLKQEIKTLTQNIKQKNRLQKPVYENIVKEIKTRLQNQIPEIRIQIFGSFATDLNLQVSDIDIVIIARQNGQNNSILSQRKTQRQRRIHKIFQHVCSQLKQMTEFIMEVNYLQKATIPIIKATCNADLDFKSIDLSFQDEQHNGIKSVQLIKNYLQVYPQALNLVLVLKKFIYQSKLFAPYHGGLSSYALFLMIIAFIQNQQLRVPIDKKHPNYDQNLRTAQLLISFLKFYGFKMDYVTQKIIARRPDPLNTNNVKTIVYNSQWQNQFPPQPKLIIMDPLYEQNNVGKPTWRIKQIKMAFQLAFIAIHTNKRCRQKRSCQSYKKIKSIRIQQIRFKQNKRPCCILQRMFRSTDINLQQPFTKYC